MTAAEEVLEIIPEPYKTDIRKAGMMPSVWERNDSYSKLERFIVNYFDWDNPGFTREYRRYMWDMVESYEQINKSLL